MSTPHADFGDLADGTYFLRIAAIGLPANGPRRFAAGVVSFERRRVRTDGVRRAARRQSRVRVPLVREPRAPASGENALSLRHGDDSGSASSDRRSRRSDAEGQLVVSDLPPGVYYWTIVAEQFQDNGRFWRDDERGPLVHARALDVGVIGDRFGGGFAGRSQPHAIRSGLARPTNPARALLNTSTRLSLDPRARLRRRAGRVPDRMGGDRGPRPHRDLLCSIGRMSASVDHLVYDHFAELARATGGLARHRRA